MTLGHEQRYPPGYAVSTDKPCGNSADGFCSYLDADAIDSDAVQEGMLMCTGCNEEMSCGSFDHVSLDEVYASRDKQNPSWR